MTLNVDECSNRVTQALKFILYLNSLVAAISLARIYATISVDMYLVHSNKLRT